VKIFHKVDAVGRGARVEKPKCFNDVAHLVAAVIEDDVRRSEFRDDIAQEIRVGLASNPDFDLIFLKGLALGIYVNSNDLRVGAQVALPQLRRPAAAASDLQKNHGAVDEAAEVRLVDGEIVLPLVDCSLLVIDELGPQTQSILAFVHAARKTPDESDSRLAV
jgi:hypothetical protein